MLEFTCPECGSHFFGTSNCTGPEEAWIRNCHGYKQDGQPCRFSFPLADDDKYFADRDKGEKQMNKEYEAIAAKFAGEIYDATSVENAHGIVRSAVEACYALANKPVRELTDAEIEKIIVDTRALSMQGTCRAIEAAAHAKQREPERVTVKVRFWRHTGNAQNMAEIRSYTSAEEYLTSEFPGGYTNAEWLGPEQSFEVVLP